MLDDAKRDEVVKYWLEKNKDSFESAKLELSQGNRHSERNVSGVKNLLAITGGGRFFGLWPQNDRFPP